MIKKIVSSCIAGFNELSRIHSMQVMNKRFQRSVLKFDVPDVSDSEFDEILTYYKNKTHRTLRLSRNFYAFMKYMNPSGEWENKRYPLYQYVSESVHYANMIRTLNPIEYAKALSDKGMYGFLFQGYNRPYEYLRKCNGFLLDNENRQCAIENCILNILSDKEPVIFKQSTETSGGHGVAIVRDYSTQSLENLINSWGNNFVVQKLVKQSPQISALNESSLNTFRIYTLCLNNSISVVARTIRVGHPGCDVDNVSQGGALFGVTKNGFIMEGFDYKSVQLKNAPSGLSITDMKINHYERIDDFVISLHSRIPVCAFAAWDVALDDNDNPVLIEVNLQHAGINMIQMINGPIFKERFDEVMDFCFEKK